MRSVRPAWEIGASFNRSCVLRAIWEPCDNSCARPAPRSLTGAALGERRRCRRAPFAPGPGGVQKCRVGSGLAPHRPASPAPPSRQAPPSGRSPPHPPGPASPAQRALPPHSPASAQPCPLPCTRPGAGGGGGQWSRDGETCGPCHRPSQRQLPRSSAPTARQDAAPRSCSPWLPVNSAG